MRAKLLSRFILTLAAFFLTPASTLTAPLVRQATGFAPADIQNAVTTFRADLGEPIFGEPQPAVDVPESTSTLGLLLLAILPSWNWRRKTE